MKTFVFSLVLCALLCTQVSGGGVKKCYAKRGTETCTSDLLYDSVCYSMRISTAGQYIYNKGCTLNSPHFINNCQSTNNWGGSCYMCDTDLCNVN